MFVKYYVLREADYHKSAFVSGVFFSADAAREAALKYAAESEPVDAQFYVVEAIERVGVQPVCPPIKWEVTVDKLEQF